MQLHGLAQRETNRINHSAFLRLNGANAKEHSVFKELNRVKQYFEKIKIAENGKQGPNLRVDKAAAGRIVKHALVNSLSNPMSLY